MIINRQGCTRLVFVFSTFVVKIPNIFNGFRCFIYGFSANINERDIWVYNGYTDHQKQMRDLLLCPVLWASWGSWLLIMRRVEVCQPTEKFIDYTPWWAAGFGGDDKPMNYGFLDGRMVKLDYGYTQSPDGRYDSSCRD